jgi:hypothetical protein
MTQKAALNALCEGSPENYNKDGERSESFNNFPGTYRKYTKYIDYVPWPTPCEVAVEISLMANCEHLAAESMGQSKFDWAERTLKQQRSIREEAKADQWVWRQWVFEPLDDKVKDCV